MDDLIPLAKVYSKWDIYLSSTSIRIGSNKSDPLKHLPGNFFPVGTGVNSKVPTALASFYPNLQRLITKHWFISLKSFSFQWNVQTFGDNKTLSILAKIFEHASQLPNLRIFAWIIDCTCEDPKEDESDEESTNWLEENELPTSKELFTSNSNIFPRVETMKISFHGRTRNFVSIPILFFEEYFSNTKCLSELQIMVPCTGLYMESCVQTPLALSLSLSLSL